MFWEKKQIEIWKDAMKNMVTVGVHRGYRKCIAYVTFKSS